MHRQAQELANNTGEIAFAQEDIMEKHHFLTRDGLNKIQAELEHLRSEGRREIADKIKQAKDMGGTDNNAEYDDAKNEQAFLEGNILRLESLLNNTSVIDSSDVSVVVQIGSSVVVRDQDGKEEKYSIVDGVEASPLDGRISYDSPVGQALMGKRVSSEVTVPVPAGTLKLFVISIE